jgi:hypothetical protein
MQIINILEHSYNLLYSFAMLLSIATWGLTSLGLFGGEAKEILSIDDGSIDIPEGGNWFEGIADTLGIGMVPTSILVTIFLFFLGLSGIVLNENLLALTTSGGFGYYALLGINFLGANIGGLGATAILNRPLRYLFKDYGKASSANSLVGKVAKVSSGKVNQLSGQALLELEDGNKIEVAVRTTEDNASISHGQQILLLEFDKEKNIYWVEVYPVATDFQSVV